MVKITDKSNCCGCSACAQACPKQCISFDEDSHGFRYPSVDESLCVNCNLCEKVCPVKKDSKTRVPIKVYASKNASDEERLASSSGGIFSLLSKQVLRDGGVVFGAMFDENWEVRHWYIDNENDLPQLRGSKYLQSRIESSYTKAHEFLCQGRQVLFSGTSCQIEGLLLFLGKEYDNLLTVDLVCHGVPSPKVWRDYLLKHKLINKSILDRILKPQLEPQITNVNFRDKRIGWKKYGLSIHGKLAKAGDSSEELSLNFFQPMAKNLYFSYFLSDMGLRPSCHFCPSKSGKCGSDITLADYWGIGKTYPEFDDDKGVSLVLLYTDKGRRTFDETGAVNIETDYEDAIQRNGSIVKSYAKKEYVDWFWRLYDLIGLKSIYAIKIWIRLNRKIKMLKSEF